jgi:histidinol-phosphate phosphatase family protein
MKQAVILAGGEGTRLRSILGNLPKPLVNVAGIPLLERQILELKKYGFSKVLLLVNFRYEAITLFLESRNFFNIDITVLNDGPNALGNGGALLGAFELLDHQFLVLYGDTLFDIAIDKMVEFHETKTNSDVTIFVHPNDHPFDSDLVFVDEDNLVLKFLGYPHPKDLISPNLVNAAFYICEKKALEPFLLYRNIKSDIAKFVFPKLLELGNKIYAYLSPEYIKDCGTPDRLSRATRDLLSGRVSRRNLRYKQSAIFLDRDGTLNELNGHISSPKDLNLIVGVGEAIKKINDSGKLAILATNQPVIARGECNEAGLKLVHNKLEMELSQCAAYLDAIYYCPHHPDGGFQGEVANLKINCLCRKPMPGLIEAAAKKFNIDLSESWIIGDSSADVGVAKNAGLRSIIVKTGNMGLDCKYHQYPDFVFPNLNSAVDFIANDFDLNLQRISDYFLKNQYIDRFIFIGGASRSGKSTLASLIKYAYEKTGIKVKVINLDRWIKSEIERGESVIDRYDLVSIEATVLKILNMKDPIKIELPFYDKANRSQIKFSQSYENIDPSDKIVFEGTIALALNSSKAHLRIHMDIDELLRYERFKDEYLSRGYSLDVISNLNQSRSEELDYINQHSLESVRATFIDNLIKFGGYDN